MEEKLNRRPHKLELQNRERGSITGVQDVVSFDENQIILDTDMGLLTLKGKNMHVSRLTLENCDNRVSLPMAGHIDSLNASVAAGVMMYRVLASRKG